MSTFRQDELAQKILEYFGYSMENAPWIFDDILEMIIDSQYGDY